MRLIERFIHGAKFHYRLPRSFAKPSSLARAIRFASAHKRFPQSPVNVSHQHCKLRPEQRWKNTHTQFAARAPNVPSISVAARTRRMGEEKPPIREWASWLTWKPHAFPRARAGVKRARGFSRRGMWAKFQNNRQSSRGVQVYYKQRAFSRCHENNAEKRGARRRFLLFVCPRRDTIDVCV